MLTVFLILAIALVAAVGSVAGIRGALALSGRRVRKQGAVPVLVRERSGADGLPMDWRRVGGLRLQADSAIVTWSGRQYGPLRFAKAEFLDPDVGLRIGFGRQARIVPAVDGQGRSIEIGVPGREVAALRPCLTW
jgi:hypothetical protein